MCVACRLSLPMLCVFVLFVSCLTVNVSSLLVYNRQTLLDLRLQVKDLVKLNQDGHQTLPPLLSGIPAHLCRTPAPPPRRKRTCRRRGKRSGWLVKLKDYLAHCCSASKAEFEAVPTLFFSRRSPRFHLPTNASVTPVIGAEQVFQPRGCCSPRPRRRGVNHLHVFRAPRTAEVVVSPVPVRIGEC